MSIKTKILFFSFLLILSNAAVPDCETGRKEILELLQIKQSEQSIDYVNNQKQFQLHSLITEQRHAKTWNLSFTIKTDTRKGLEMLLSVDKDITEKIKNLSRYVGKINNASLAIEEAILKGKKVYFYGCGATGRLAKQMESSFWRPFWKKIKSKAIWKKLSKKIPADIETRLIGEMTGGDRALISSLEGFEDLQLIGKLQLKDRGIEMGDVVICVTEGGETSSVIGTILAALEQYGKMNLEKSKLAKKNLYFIYNNPDEVLSPFARSRKVLENPYITKINLTTGSQSITGSTRMQATTSETFVAGIILEHALDNILRRYITKPEMEALGFRPGISISKRLLEFIPLQESVYELNHLISELTDLEAGTYADNCFSTYFADNALITVFIDSTERSPTFRLFPLDTVKAPKRKSWIQVWTTAEHGQEAWKNFLGRPFYGLKSQFYREPFLNNIKDKYLKAAALSSLKNAGDDQQFLYDFSFADFNKKNRCPQKNDLGVLVLLDDEIENLTNPESSFCLFIDFFNQKHANLVCIVVSKKPVKNIEILTKKLKADNKKNQLLPLVINVENDPLWIRQHIALKMLLNAHSTAVMAKLGKVVGNTMTSVNPGNLKLIGRATYLIQSHVNDVLSQENWTRKYGKIKPVTYNDANAVLFDTVDYLKDRNISGSDVGGSISEVDISIIRVLEAYRKNSNVSWESVMSTYRKFGLESYLISL